MFLAIAHLPNAGVRELPVFTYPLKAIADLNPNIVRGGTHVFVGKIKSVHEFAVHIPLELPNGIVTDAYRSGSSIPFPMIQSMLRKLIVAFNRENGRSELFRTDVLGRVVFHPAHESRRLIPEADAQKRINCERRIADPCVPVIPVASASDDFRQAGGGCGDNGSGGFKSKKL